MKVVVVLLLTLLAAGCTSLVPSGAGARSSIGYNQAFERAEAFIRKHDVKTASLMRTTEDDDAYYFLYSLEHDKVAQPFRRTVRVNKSNGRIKVINDY